MKELTIEAKIENLSCVMNFVTEQLENVSCSPAAQMQIELAVDEIFTNISMYAYAPEIGLVTIQVESDEPGFITLTFIDSGIPYDPLAKEDPDTTLSASERQIGGLGIFLVKKTMDGMAYEYKEGHNILHLKKHL